jgi:hypothetical protein
MEREFSQAPTPPVSRIVITSAARAEALLVMTILMGRRLRVTEKHTARPGDDGGPVRLGWMRPRSMKIRLQRIGIARPR